MWARTGLTRQAVEQAGKALIRHGGKQILLVAQEGELFAIANRCPHEGYPLSEGTLGPGCVITCNWHNWKFDLASGGALIGRDPVRRYALREEAGELLVDLSEPPPDAQQARALAGLDAALADYDRPRLAREAARLLRSGGRIEAALAHTIAATASRFEDGMSHAHAAAADWLTLAVSAPDAAHRLAAQLEPFAHLGWDIRGAADFPFDDEISVWHPARFLSAVEHEREAEAVAMVRAALAMGLGYRALRPVLARAALAHYADFGHSAIYVLKAGELIERLGAAATEPVTLLLTRSLVRATREDLVPEFRFYAGALAAWPQGGDEPLSPHDLERLNVDAILKRLLRSAKRPVRELYDALLGAAAFNLLHFDLGFDRATDNALADNVGWLDFTHALTFANAARQLCAETPKLWPAALLQLGLFVARNVKYATQPVETARWAVTDHSAFVQAQFGGLYDHGIPEPIIACHRLKVLFALKSELAAAPDAPWAEAMCAAVNRYLSMPMKRHHSLRLATQALEFVAREG